MGPFAVVQYNLTLCQLQNMYHGRPYAWVDLNPMPHCKKNPIYVFLEKELRCLSPNFHIHVYVSDLYISRIYSHIFLQ